MLINFDFDGVIADTFDRLLPDRGAKPNREHVDHQSEPACRQVVTQLMHEYGDAKKENKDR